MTGRATDRFSDSTRTNLIRSILFGPRLARIFHHCVGKLPAQSFDAVQRQSHLANFFRVDRSFALNQKLLSRLLALFGKQSTEFEKAALSISHQTDQLAAQVYYFALNAIAFDRVRGFSDDPLNFVRRQTGSWRDAHLLFAAGGLVRG